MTGDFKLLSTLGLMLVHQLASAHDLLYVYEAALAPRLLLAGFLTEPANRDQRANTANPTKSISSDAIRDLGRSVLRRDFSRAFT